MNLLERDLQLQALATALDAAAVGEGRIAVVSGEAGIGKTSFVERFLADRGATLRVLKGNCDSLFHPSPLGPLYDIAYQTGGRLLNQLEVETPRAALFATMLGELDSSGQPTLLVFEDVHWADEATLDLIKFLSRRIAQLRVLIILTHRDDGAAPALRLLLGDLTPRSTIRIALPRLTVDAVRTLVADHPFDAVSLHSQTSGNPFFVTEVLANTGSGIPPTVRDAVLARAATLGTNARHVLEAAAMLGSRIDHVVLGSIFGGEADGLADCMTAGLLEATVDGVAFRHELVRDTILHELDAVRRRSLCRLAFAALKASGIGRGDFAQLAELAAGAGDAEAVLEYGLAAARADAAVGAHRAAAAQYLRVLEYAGDRPPAERAQLYETYAEECAIVDNQPEAIRGRRQAIELWRLAGDRVREGANLSALAWPLVRSGQNMAAHETSRCGLAALESLPPSRELADAYRMHAHLRMLDRDCELAVELGTKAIALATILDDKRTIVATEIVVGSALLVDGDEAGAMHLNRALALAREEGWDALAGLAYLNIGSSYGEQYQFAKAEHYLVEGIDYARERDLDHATHYMTAWLALVRLYQGRWDEALELAEWVVRRPGTSAITRIMALVALGRLRTRRGTPGAEGVLDEALQLALQTDTLQRLAPVRSARAEAAWFAGDHKRVVAEAMATYELAERSRHCWHAGEFAFWRRLCGNPVVAPAWSASPFTLQMSGDWRRAAEQWARLGCPYEQARALADGDTDAQLAALEIFDRLGAGPAAAVLRQRMRGDGVRRIPRGPRATTRRNRFGLTLREMEVLACIAIGLSNGRIGARLHVSPKTIDHHVSSVLAKLGATSRGEAAEIARMQKLLSQNGETLSEK
jgi:DNA-binding CsgD family transcriptional regulator/tetratricopeptide (TPR) repeat protein